ncbi:alginate export family protein [Parerythrobacter lacustris]|uniref:Alginate export family protein n=1 Tax=Parerythrobacter lacustris TaxID=2969984 RepID=A0ABT1XTR5_9SPHN|nr:alginate export family protein [Parerythrobacter lacustris]MCR2835060.1 alginate export family protein [Parerythrobacter lacustris]
MPGHGSAEEIKLEPQVDLRLRYESAVLDDALRDADAVTLRARVGAKAVWADFSLLAESEATAALVTDYNAFPFPQAEDQRRLTYAAIPDPANIELNRLQLDWRKGDTALTVGRQRIELDDQRWIGSAGWRQNEQTFDAVRGQTAIGPVRLDASYLAAQRTLFGIDAGSRQAVDGEFVLLGAGTKLAGFNVKAFAYLLDFDEAFAVGNSSQTFGVLAQGGMALGKAKIDLKGSYARQADWRNPVRNFAADYGLAEVNATLGSFAVGLGWELLGSDNGSAVQMPFGSQHKFNGFADVFVTTPPDGLEDAYASFSYTLPVPGKPRASIIHHRFGSAAGSVDYGSEWNAVISAKIGKVGLMAKYANYHAEGFSVDTERFWLQVEFVL